MGNSQNFEVQQVNQCIKIFEEPLRLHADWDKVQGSLGSRLKRTKIVNLKSWLLLLVYFDYFLVYEFFKILLFLNFKFFFKLLQQINK